MKKINEHTITAGAALLAMLFLFVMTAEQGKYWGNNEMDQYIVKITEGDELAYLNSNTPTAMVVRGIGEGIFVCKGEQCAKRKFCTVAENGFVITEGRKVAKASFVECN